MAPDIMSGFVTVDVRDMTCAQALALIAQAVARLAAGTSLEVLYSTDDVKADVLVWARDLGHLARDVSPAVLQLEKGTR